MNRRINKKNINQINTHARTHARTIILKLKMCYRCAKYKETRILDFNYINYLNAKTLNIIYEIFTEQF